MADLPKQLTGRCLCGAVTYTVDAEPIVSGVCHCQDCQRQTGSPFTVFVGVPEAAFELSGDTLASYTTVGEDHGGDTERFFCTACGSPVYSRSPQAPEITLLKAGSIDDSSWLEPAMEIYLDSAQPWSPRFEAPAQFERGPQPA
jgi:hypothetical protein